MAFLMMVESVDQERDVAFLMDSIRAFAGDAANVPVYVVLADSRVSGALVKARGARLVPLKRNPSFPAYPFLDKVWASAQVEALAEKDVDLLVWINAEALVVSPLRDLDLPPNEAAAVRPVHLQNVGIPAGAAPDDFWAVIHEAAGVTPERMFPVESFVDGRHIQAYFNTHIFAVRPQAGILRAWKETFESLIRDAAFQKAACPDELHRIFLHQAVLSALIVGKLHPGQIRILPPSYSYPLHLQDQVPAERRARTVNSLVVLVHEESLRNPSWLKVLPADEPLRSWLIGRARSDSAPTP